MENLTPQEIQEFRDIFNLVDKDGGGTISEDELCELLETLGVSTTPEEVSLMIQEIDQDSNGVIDFEEFCAVMSKRVSSNYTPQQVINAFKAFQAPGAPTGMIHVNDVIKALTEYGSSKLSVQQAKDLLNPTLYFPPETTEIIIERVFHKAGTVYIRKYQKGIIIGKGGFAKCYVFKNLDTGKIYAGKVIDKSGLVKDRTKRKLATEIEIHKKLDHVNVVKFKHNFDDDSNVYIILELCANQTMMELLKRNKRLIESETRLYTTQLVSALSYIHGQYVIHRDLKLANLFLDHNMNLKIGDFGLAAKLSYPTEKKHTVCGTPNYIAPEVLTQSTGHSFKADIWSLGVIIYTILVGKPPFETKDVRSTYKRIKANAYSFPDNVHISEKAKSLIRSILHTVPEARPELKDILDHPFFATSESLDVAYDTLNQSMCSPLEQRANELLNAKEEPKPLVENFAPSPNLISANEMEMADFPPTLEELKKQAEHTPLQVPHRKETLESIHFVLDYCIIQGHLPSIQSLDRDNSPPTSWITHYVDYTRKYGLGYLFCDGSVGIYFNDATKIVLESAGSWFEYYDRPMSNRDPLTPQRHCLSMFPENLLKKVTLLTHFRDYLKSQYIKTPRHTQDDLEAQNRGSVNTNMVYVKKWVKTRHAILFRLSNKSVQISFFDNSEILLCHDGRIVSYVDRNGNRLTQQLELLLNSDRNDAIKRIKYTRDILQQLVKDTSNKH